MQQREQQLASLRRIQQTMQPNNTSSPPVPVLPQSSTQSQTPVRTLSDFARLLRQAQPIELQAVVSSRRAPTNRDNIDDDMVLIGDSPRATDDDLPTERPRPRSRTGQELLESGHFGQSPPATPPTPPRRTSQRRSRRSSSSPTPSPPAPHRRSSGWIIHNDTGAWQEVDTHLSCRRLPLPSFWRIVKSDTLVTVWISLPGIMPEQLFLVWPSEEDDRLTPVVIIKPANMFPNNDPGQTCTTFAFPEEIKIPLVGTTPSIALDHVGKMPTQYSFANGLLRMSWPTGSANEATNVPTALFQSMTLATAPTPTREQMNVPTTTPTTTPQPATTQPAPASSEVSGPIETALATNEDDEEEERSFDSATLCEMEDERKLDEQSNWPRYYHTH